MHGRGHTSERADKAEILLNHLYQGLKLCIVPKAKDTLHRLKDPDLAETEPEWQLFEGCFYDYELSDSRFTLDDSTGYGIVSRHKTNPHLGQIATNIYTGTIELTVMPVKGSSVSAEKRSTVRLEIQSLKTGYREDYRAMLEDITEKCTDLVMQSGAPAMHYFEPVYGSEEEKQRALYQRFAFIKSVVDSEDFAEAVHRVITRPVTRWTETEETVDIRRVRRFSRSNLREIANATNRSGLPESNYLNRHRGITSVPSRIASSRKTDSFDTPENRFVRHALETFLQFCSGIYAQAGHSTGLRDEVKAVMVRLESHLNHSLFREISRAQQLPLNSPVLQRREGYREVLRAWLMFDLAAKLVWKGGDDVYGGRKKDVATLYEYWLFFHLLDLLQSVFSIEKKSLSELLEVTDRGLDIRLRQGLHIPLYGVYENPVRNLNVRFSYNRPFRGGNPYMRDGNVALDGSWSASMRPDYTLSMWPERFTEKQAEASELIVHIHFDAKYKVEQMLGLLPDVETAAGSVGFIEPFDVGGWSWERIAGALTRAGVVRLAKDGRLELLLRFWQDADVQIEGMDKELMDRVAAEIESQLLSFEKLDQRKGSYRNADLLKMHAYKDAIRRTGGAYVLYPGSAIHNGTKKTQFRGFHEIIPGLGAFAVRPAGVSGGAHGIGELRSFIVEVRDLFISRLSQHEKMARQSQLVHRDTPPGSARLMGRVPEFLESGGLLNPDETWVLVGYYRSDEHLSWIHREGMYNFRAVSEQMGALVMNERTAGARYLLLHNRGESRSTHLFKLNGEGPIVMMRSRLVESTGYPAANSRQERAYYVYRDIKPCNDDEFAGKIFDLNKLEGFTKAQERGHPLTVNLTNLMAAIYPIS
jgi:predicted component of viral defense system (DUF524 family)